VDAMLAPETPDAQIAAALALLVAKGENPDELAGFADALYQRVLPIPKFPVMCWTRRERAPAR
jgi:anthranilate phosphoribosyltransferase